MSVCLLRFHAKTIKPINIKLCTHILRGIRKDIKLFLLKNYKFKIHI